MANQKNHCRKGALQFQSLKEVYGESTHLEGHNAVYSH